MHIIFQNKETRIRSDYNTLEVQSMNREFFFYERAFSQFGLKIWIWTENTLYNIPQNKLKAIQFVLVSGRGVKLNFDRTILSSKHSILKF